MELPLLHAATGPYQFSWHLHPDVVLFCIFLQAGYLYAVTQLRDVISDAGRVKRSQVALFTAGVISIYLAAGTPMHDISEQYLLSAHMLQHTILTIIAAPLLLAGLPGWLFQAPLRNAVIFKVAKTLTHPVVAFGLFNLITIFTHLPPAMDYSLTHHWFHFVVHAALVGSAMLMWWPVLSTVPELPRLSSPLQMAYLFLQSLVPTVIAAFVTFADNPVYSFYERAPRTWGLTAVEDQQIAGGVMKLLGSLIIWGFIAVIFFKWYERDLAESREPRWDEVEDELEALGLTHSGKRQG